MMARGLIRRLPDPSLDIDDDDPDDQPVPIKGEPLSETIIRERRWGGNGLLRRFQRPGQALRDRNRHRLDAPPHAPEPVNGHLHRPHHRRRGHLRYRPPPEAETMAT
jgi:hypothetical protein